MGREAVNASTGDVYQPSDDTYLLIDALESADIEECDMALEVGCGSGAVVEKLLEFADDVVAVDLKLPALRATLARVKNDLHRVHVVASDRVAFLRAGAPVRLIACNPPYLPKDHDEQFDSDVHGGPRGTEFSEELVSSLVEVLNERGWDLLLVTSSRADYRSLFRLSEALGLSTTVVAKKKLFFEEIFCLKLRPAGR